MPVLNDDEFPRLANYTALVGSQGPFPVPFPAEDAADIGVYVNGTAIAGWSYGSGAVTLNAPLPATSAVTVLSETRPHSLSGNLVSREALAREIDRLWASVQELHGRVDRTPNFSVLYPNASTYEIPDPVDQRVVVFGTESFLLGPLVSQLGYMSDEFMPGALIVLEDGHTIQWHIEQLGAQADAATGTVGVIESTVATHTTQISSLAATDAALSAVDVALDGRIDTLETFYVNFESTFDLSDGLLPSSAGARRIGSKATPFNQVWAENVWTLGRLGYPDNEGLGEEVEQDPNDNQSGKDSTVTCNKRCGRIVTHNETIVAGGVKTFRVNCPLMTPTTIPVIGLKSPRDKYVVSVDAWDDTGFWIAMENRDSIDRSNVLRIAFLLFDAAVN